MRDTKIKNIQVSNIESINQVINTLVHCVGEDHFQ